MESHASYSSLQAPGVRALLPPGSGRLPCVEVLAGPKRGFRRIEKAELEDLGPGVWNMPAGVTISLLIWP